MTDIIAIDDDEIILEFYKYTFADEGITVFNNVADAEEWLEGHNTKAIILDFYMPFYDGKTIPEIIDSLKKHAPILICSGVEDARVGEVCIKQGATAFIFKNGDAAKLKRTVKGIING